MGNSSDVVVGAYVEITLAINPAERSKGKVSRILSGLGSDRTTVVLTNGDKGDVTRVIRSTAIIRERIMAEGQTTENKENFGEAVMREKVIPQTVQSFLNSDGGYLYIGVKDTGSLMERLVGLDYDFGQIKGSENMANDKLCDKLERKIISTLEKYLSPSTGIGSLVHVSFIKIEDVQIAEILVRPSSKPRFFRHLTKGNKEKQFDLYFKKEKMGARVLDDFYIRGGGSKKLLGTHEKFYEYAMERFGKT